MVDPQEMADVAWILAAATVVLLMFPGLALFYGGMAGSKNVLNMFAMAMSTLGTVTIIYVLYGHGMVLGESLGGIIGNPTDYFGIVGYEASGLEGGFSETLDLAFFTLFACITVSIIASGALGRMKFSAWLIFSVLWATLVYFPLGHWVFGDGWMGNTFEFHDYAGGTAVHMASGFGALALALVLGKRKNMGERPHNMPLVLLGAGILWMGWFGFNGGTAEGANYLAQYTVMTTLFAGGTGMLGFMLYEKIVTGKATVLGLCSGIVAGLVAITPAADAVDPFGALTLGLIAGFFVAWACTWKTKLGIDESLDAFAVHGIGGIVGAMFVVFFGWATYTADEPIRGIFFGGEWSLLFGEMAAIGVTCAYAFGVTWVLVKVMDLTMKIRVEEDAEEDLDFTLHGQTAYDIK
ncbi:ammonium transporter [Nesterenkonia flava]|uniref:Ammonium transporter n=1 Tax=Nesterenkonia flava TaxID=469799 RepID=A0ABU1FVH7_9MICC|nr:ammonium transporter [Nesterenkonia flava]MDR5712267.1 ammonium transporter [Nesterenkonia flava]